MIVVEYPIVPQSDRLQLLMDRVRDRRAPEDVDTHWFESIGLSPPYSRFDWQDSSETRNAKEETDRKRKATEHQLCNLLFLIGFADEEMEPTETWFQYRGEDHQHVLALAIVEGYQEIFRSHPHAHQCEPEDLRNTFRKTSRASDYEITFIIETFKMLCEMADFSEIDIEGLVGLHDKIPVYDAPPHPVDGGIEPTIGAGNAHAMRAQSVEETLQTLQGLSLEQEQLFRDALFCARNDINRAAVIMAWVAFVDFLEEKLGEDGLSKVKTAYPKWSDCQGFEEIRDQYGEHQFLEAACKVGLLKPDEKELVIHLKVRRNKCAHPGEFRPDFDQALGYISELLNWVTRLREREL